MPKPHKTPLVRGEKLTDRGKAKLRSQIKRADMLLRTEKRYSDGWYMAQRMKVRARKLLGEPAKATAKPTKGDKAAKRRVPFEKATGTGRLKEALIGVAKRAQKANGGS